jgi:DnaD/phage-associated family protein
MGKPLNTFEGFSSGKTHLVPIPDQFFYDILPGVRDLAELKFILYLFWRLDRIEGAFRYILYDELMDDQEFLEMFSESLSTAKNIIESTIKLAHNHQVILMANLEVDDDQVKLLFLNTPKGRAAINAIDRGEWRKTNEARLPIELNPERPNIYTLYEENIGLLTPMISESLEEAEKTYPPQWIEDAFRIAVENNIRNWRYISAILNGWQQKGRYERKDQRDTEEARKRYSEWEE